MKKAMMMSIIKKNINLGGLVSDLLDKALKPALQKVVDDSANPYDNMLMATAYPIMEQEIKAKVEEFVNKLFETEEVKP